MSVPICDHHRFVADVTIHDSFCGAPATQFYRLSPTVNVDSFAPLVARCSLHSVLRSFYEQILYSEYVVLRVMSS
jgi:hypothetical protein